MTLSSDQAILTQAQNEQILADIQTLIKEEIKMSDNLPLKGEPETKETKKDL